jgi:hypothetical protein
MIRPPLFAGLQERSVYPRKGCPSLLLTAILASAISGCALCPEQDFDRVVKEKTFVTFYPLGFYHFNEDEFGSARIDEIGLRGRHHAWNSIYIGADYQGSGSPVDGGSSSIFYEGIVEIHRLLFTADYEFVIRRRPLARLGVGIYPGWVIPMVDTDSDLEDELKRQGRRVSQRIESAFDVRIGAKLIWNPVTRSREVWRPGVTVHAGYELTSPARAHTRLYDGTGTIERASEAVDLGGFFLLFGIEF